MEQLASFLGFGSATGTGFSSCSPSSIPYPTTLPNAEFLSVEAHLVTNYTEAIPPGFENSFFAPSSPLPALNFCNVTLVHTHPGLGDRILTQVWLPLGDGDSVYDSGKQQQQQQQPMKATDGRTSPPWNGRLQGVGGAGTSTGFMPLTQYSAVAEGYAVVTTDGGHRSTDWASGAWALASPGNVDWNAVQNYAAVALHDAAVIGRAVTEAFYGRKLEYAYFTGCSTGGRQAALLAQRWPDDYDGFLGGAPAVRGHEIAVALAPQARMLELGYAPPACELRELRRLAVERCDGLDGVVDGLVSEPERCFAAFEPRSHVGDEFVCEEAGGKTLQITEAGVEVARLAWEGLPDDAGGVVWGGLGHQAELSAWAGTTCDYGLDGDGDAAGTPKCKPEPWPLAMAWVQYFLHRDPAKPTDPTAFFRSGVRDVARLVHQARQWYASLLGTFDADLSDLRDGGGKLLLWHGMADEAIPLNNSRAYHSAVAARDPGRVDGNLRYFESPGVTHCGLGGDGRGLVPSSSSGGGRLLDVLRAWVEEGVVPESVPAVSKEADPATGVRATRPLCWYPRKAKYDGVGDVASADSFRCSRKKVGNSS
ncbi:feruloyl esterase [Apiospora marii]|uniref:Carboxylic ester hydrolase n=1 Tax=Apiospora marii TaxID=335849 RepID=A0ABR1R113_9PEZI